MIIFTVKLALLFVGATFIWLLVRKWWAFKVLKVDPLVAYNCKGLSAIKEYFESRYDEQFALIKWRVVKHLREHRDHHFRETAELLAYASEPVIWREESSPANTLFIELEKSASVVQVHDTPADLLKDLDKIERAADILGVEYTE